MPEFSPLRDYHLTAQIADISAAGQAYVAVPSPGKVIEIRTVIHNAITTSNATLTAKINGTAITGGVITVTQAGSAGGDTDIAVPSALNDVQEGDALELETNAASATACRCDVTFVIRK